MTQWGELRRHQEKPRSLLVSNMGERWSKPAQCSCGNDRFLRGPARLRSCNASRKCNELNSLYRAIAPVPLLVLGIAGAPTWAASTTDPLRFFAGVTETVGTTRILMHKPVQTRSIGRGQIKPDGSLLLVQRVEDEGRTPYLRTWEIRQVGRGRFIGTMSQAAGPVLIEQVGNPYRFSFRMKGDMSVEQWLAPLPGGLSASSTMTIRKFGLAVASSTALVRKIS